MKESTKMMRLVMEDLKNRSCECKRKNNPLWGYDQDKELTSKIQRIGDTINFFRKQRNAMEVIVSTSTHNAYIRKINSWIKELDDLRMECISALNDIRAAQDVRSKMDDYEKFCMNCGWNDPDYGCTSPPYEELWQCPMYQFYHPEEVEEFERYFEEWARKMEERSNE